MKKTNFGSRRPITILEVLLVIGILALIGWVVTPVIARSFERRAFQSSIARVELLLQTARDFATVGGVDWVLRFEPKGNGYEAVISSPDLTGGAPFKSGFLSGVALIEGPPSVSLYHTGHVQETEPLLFYDRTGQKKQLLVKQLLQGEPKQKAPPHPLL